MIDKAVSGIQKQTTYGDFFSAAHDHLWEGYRSEYLYKNAIARKVLFRRQSSLATTSMFCEFAVEQAKLDVLLVNGTTTAYEIKTELDCLDRLETQLHSYCRVFDRVFVVTCKSLSRRVLSAVPSVVGSPRIDQFRVPPKTSRRSVKHRVSLSPVQSLTACAAPNTRRFWVPPSALYPQFQTG